MPWWARETSLNWDLVKLLKTLNILIIPNFWSPGYIYNQSRMYHGSTSTFCTVHPLAVIPKLSAQWRKTRAPDANGVGTALSYGTVADARDRIEAWGGSEAQRRQSWRGLDLTTEPRLGITQLCVCTFRLVSDAACTGTMGMVRGCAEDARCHTAHMSSLTYESRLNAGYWLCLRGPTGSQTFQQQQRECSEVDAARRRAPWIPKLSEYLQQHLYN